MEYRLIKTGDADTIINDKFSEHYHSLGGSIAESEYVFIEAGLRFFVNKNPNRQQIRIFEVGFGSGLNALLTFIEAKKLNKIVHYHSIELYPVPFEIAEKFDLAHLKIYKNYFLTLHKIQWNKLECISENFCLKKILDDWTKYKMTEIYDIIYYDAFSYNTQPEMWSLDRFQMLYKQLSYGGVLVTYAAKGEIKRNLKAAGFKLQRLKGALHKKHMLRAFKE